MSVEAGLIGFAALASLAMTKSKHRPSPPLPIMPSRGLSHFLGWFLLAVSIAFAIKRFGGVIGMVAWVGELCIAGAMLVLLLSWKPRYAFPAGGLAMVPGLVLALN